MRGDDAKNPSEKSEFPFAADDLREPCRRCFAHIMTCPMKESVAIP